MDAESVLQYLSAELLSSALPGLMSFIRVPNQSPHFDSEWAQNGLQEEAAAALEHWTMGQGLKGLTWRVFREQDWPPLIVTEVQGSESCGSVLVYGHFDKQPGLQGWLESCGPTNPIVKDGKLYGRGAADDGYCLFMTMLAVKACQHHGVAHSRIVLLLESEEESGSPHFAAYLSHLQTFIGQPDLVLCLDSNILSYDRLWVTDSMRGSVNLDLKVEMLRKGVHSGDSGIIPSSFRVMRMLVARLEDHSTGRIRLPALHSDIPPTRFKTYSETAAAIGSEWLSAFPLTAAPLSLDVVELMLNQTWRPSLAITGLGGLPPSKSAGNVLRAFTSARLAVRIPPDLPSRTALEALSAALTSDPPYGASLSVSREKASDGWVGKPLSPRMQAKVRRASELYFHAEPLKSGAGGTIPALHALSSTFPSAELLVTGVLGPQSNAHSPNESLDLTYFTRLTACVAHLFSAHSSYPDCI